MKIEDYRKEITEYCNEQYIGIGEDTMDGFILKYPSAENVIAIRNMEFVSGLEIKSF